MAEQLFFAADQAGERLDVFLSRQNLGFSRAHWQKMLRDGHVLVDGECRKANFKCRGGEEIAVELPEPEPVEILPETLPLDILYEDEAIIVVNKARGMVVHPAAGITHGTLVNALLAHCGDLSGINGEIRPGIVHRLDKDTSGVMVAAKSDAAHVDLAEQIRVKSAHRTYWAIVCGNIKEEAGVIHGAIGRHPTDRKRMAVLRQDEGGKDATTEFRVLERFGAYTLVECRLLTGRTHQIRVHMAYIGHPLVNDPKYSTRKTPFAIQGQALHSLRLVLTHPATKKEMSFEAPLPEDMQDILDCLRGQKREQ